MKKILILDDNFEILLLYRSLASNLGHKVRTTANGEEALRWATTEDFDLILTDIRMPHMDGLEFVRKLRDQGVDSKVLLITGFPTMADAHQIAQLNITETLVKPIRLTELEKVIVRELGEPDAPSEEPA